MATPYMSLTLPTVSVTAGPLWATEINAALTLVDGHDHAPGFGKPIRSAALSIDADVSFGGFNLTALRSLRLSNLGAVPALLTDVTCLAVSAGDLYYLNAAGQQVKITSGATINAAGVGGFVGDYSTSTASASYTAASSTFTFWSAANKSANLDCGNVVIRRPGTTSASGITLQSPAGLAGALTLTLPPTLPASARPLTVDASGNIVWADALTMQGDLTLSGGTQSITKATGDLWVGTADAAGVLYLKQGGFGWLSIGPSGISAITNPIHNVGTPSVSTDAATKGYVDAGVFTTKPTAPATVAGDGSTTLATKGYVDGGHAKAWALLTLGGAGAVTVTAGVGVTSASYATNLISITWATAFSSGTSYIMLATNSTNSSPAQFVPSCPAGGSRTGATGTIFGADFAGTARNWASGDIVQVVAFGN